MQKASNSLFQQQQQPPSLFQQPPTGKWKIPSLLKGRWQNPSQGRIKGASASRVISPIRISKELLTTINYSLECARDDMRYSRAVISKASNATGDKAETIMQLAKVKRMLVHRLKELHRLRLCLIREKMITNPEYSFVVDEQAESGVYSEHSAWFGTTNGIIVELYDEEHHSDSLEVPKLENGSGSLKSSAGTLSENTLNLKSFTSSGSSFKFSIGEAEDYEEPNTLGLESTMASSTSGPATSGKRLSSWIDADECCQEDFYAAAAPPLGGEGSDNITTAKLRGFNEGQRYSQQPRSSYGSSCRVLTEDINSNKGCPTKTISSPDENNGPSTQFRLQLLKCNDTVISSTLGECDLLQSQRDCSKSSRVSCRDQYTARSLSPAMRSSSFNDEVSDEHKAAAQWKTLSCFGTSGVVTFRSLQKYHSAKSKMEMKDQSSRTGEELFSERRLKLTPSQISMEIANRKLLDAMSKVGHLINTVEASLATVDNLSSSQLPVTPTETMFKSEAIIRGCAAVADAESNESHPRDNFHVDTVESLIVTPRMPARISMM